MGAEIAGANGRSGWDQWIVRETADKTIAYSFAESFFRHMAFPRKEQGIELHAFDVEKHAPRLEWIHDILDATNPDLTGFRERNGKMLMYFGWADQSLNAQMGVDYYESVMQKMGPTDAGVSSVCSCSRACSIAEAEWARGPSSRCRWWWTGWSKGKRRTGSRRRRS